MSNSYDEIKKLLESSRAMRGDDTLLNEVRTTLKKSGLLKEENFRYYIDKMQKVEYLKRKYTEWENKSEGIVWPSKKKLRYVQSFEIPRE